ncbi:ubiquinol-cytochrome c reductase iron-sulfur subunit [Amycolatopsis keratiniphila]|nr:ubiquinol-cytochrome c reductase iron-sulfur subunit [Amycolatopsis keratiniphila]
MAGTRAERRARRRVLGWWALGGAGGVAMAATYLFWPWRYVAPGQEGHRAYVLYTPMLGVTFGIAVLGMTVGMILYAKRFLPSEVSVQRRHDAEGTGSGEFDKETLVATASDATARAGLRRRSVFARVAGASVAAIGAGAGVTALGGFVKDPWQHSRSAEGPLDTLWHTGWKARAGEKVYLRLAAGDPDEIVLAGPGSVAAGGMAAVFPFRESERGHPELLAEALHRADNPATLFRLRPEVALADRPGRKALGYGDYYAYSRVCTHLGCPVSLYEDQLSRLLCPCHQSQFDLKDFGTPVFGPAVRALPQLPIALDDDGLFVATGDFTAPVGPSFWELRT